jgi:hypothetical protein
MARKRMVAVDVFFTGFFLTALALAVVIDTVGLNLTFWPPQPVQDALAVYCDALDPLFCSGRQWLATMLAVEALLYPWYILAALATLLGGGLDHASDGFEAATLVWATVNAYSVVIIVSEALAGDVAVRARSAPLYVAAYGPFFVTPIAFAVRVWTARRGAGTAVKRD